MAELITVAGGTVIRPDTVFSITMQYHQDMGARLEQELTLAAVGFKEFHNEDDGSMMVLWFDASNGKPLWASYHLNEDFYIISVYGLAGDFVPMD